MPAVRAFVRAEIRRRWRSLLIVTLLVARVGGVVLAAAAGSRRTSWRSFAESLHVSPLPATPVLLLLGVVVASVVLANAVALGPSHRAASVHPADALRAE